MGNEPSIPCCAAALGGLQPAGYYHQRQPVITERIYGLSAKHVAAVRIQTAARGWISRGRVAGARQRSIELLEHRRVTLEVQLSSLHSKFERELRQNARLQLQGTPAPAVTKGQVCNGDGLPAELARQHRQRRARSHANGGLPGSFFGSSRRLNISGVWYASGRQAGEALEESFLLTQDPESAPQDLDALVAELRELESPECVFAFVLAAGVPGAAVEKARRSDQPRSAAIGLVRNFLSRHSLEATFSGSSVEGAPGEAFRIVHGRVFRSAIGLLSVRFTQLYVDGESVVWAAKLAKTAGALTMSEGRWEGLGVLEGRFTASRAQAAEMLDPAAAVALAEAARRALSVGVSEVAVAAALRSAIDPRSALQMLVLRQVAGCALPMDPDAFISFTDTKVLAGELAEERLTELTRRAELVGLEQRAVEACVATAENPKEALIALMVERASHPLPLETPANVTWQRRRRRQVPETAAAQANASDAGVTSGVVGGWLERLWCPVQLDPWWGATLPPADADRIWFRQANGCYIQLSPIERDAAMLLLRLGGREWEAAAKPAWQVDGHGRSLVVTAEAEVRRSDIVWGPGSGCAPWREEHMDGATACKSERQRLLHDGGGQDSGYGCVSN